MEKWSRLRSFSSSNHNDHASRLLVESFLRPPTKHVRSIRAPLVVYSTQASGKRFESSNGSHVSCTLSVAHFKPSTPCPVIKLNIKRQSFFFKRIVLLQQFTREARRKKNRMASSVKYEWKKKKICKDVGGSRGGNSSVVTTNFGGSFQGDREKVNVLGEGKGHSG